MLQCLEWEPTGSYQIAAKELTENGTVSDQSGPSGLIDIHLSAEISDGSLPSNPQKAIIYHPTVSHLLAVWILPIVSFSFISLCMILGGTWTSGRIARLLVHYSLFRNSNLIYLSTILKYELVGVEPSKRVPIASQNHDCNKTRTITTISIILVRNRWFSCIPWATHPVYNLDAPNQNVVPPWELVSLSFMVSQDSLVPFLRQRLGMPSHHGQIFFNIIIIEKWCPPPPKNTHTKNPIEVSYCWLIILKYRFLQQSVRSFLKIGFYSSIYRHQVIFCSLAL